MRKLCCILPLFALLAGCNHNKDLMPFLGKWSGEFQVSEIQGGGTAKDMKRESIRGYIQVYATSRSYKMEMEGEQETIDISGAWTIKGHRITLLPETIKIDDQGGVDARDPNKKFIPAEEVQKAYGRPILLSESEDKKSLTGLKTTIGKLTGTHRFVKDSF